MTRLLFILSLGLLLPQLAGAVEVSRVLKTIDFEERHLGNNEELPMHWSKVAGPGLPHYVNGQLATDRQHGGKYSFRFDLNGGSLIYRYSPGLIKIQQGAHYRIESFCQTTVLPNARARVTAYFVDIDGRAISNNVHHSSLYAAASGVEAWQRLGVELTADSPAADSLVIELELLQPSKYQVNRLGDRALFDQDIRGSAWFDDLTISQVPEVSMRTEHAGNIFRPGEPVRVSVTVSDQSTEDLVARISLRDAVGTELYQRTGTPEVLRASRASGQQKKMLLELPPLPAGWYRVQLAMSSQGKSLESQSLDLVVLADAAVPLTPDGRFGFVATDLPMEAWSQLPQILPALSAGRVKLAVWSAQGDVEHDGDAFDRLLIRFAELGIAPTACLVAPPPKLSAKMSGGWSKLIKLKPEEWQPDLSFLLSRHANHLERWQLGADGTDVFVTDPAMREVYRQVYRQFASLVTSPDLAMPWPAWYELTGDMPAGVALSVPPSILPSQLPLYMQDLRGRTNHTLSLTLQPLDRAQYGRDVQIRDLAQRIIYALSADAQRIDLPLPLSTTHDEAGLSIQPDELLLVMRTVISTLSGTRYKGRVAIADGVEAFLFDRSGQGVLALWARGDTAGNHELAINLGDRPVCVDLTGNVTPLLRPQGEQRGRVSLTVGPMPIFLVDIDGPQAQLRASVALDQPLLESSFRQHQRRLHFVNTYPQAISGTVRIKAPAGWTLNPPTFNFNLNPGDSFDRALTIQFPYNTFAGAKLLDCDFVIQGEKNPNFNVPIALKLGLSDVGMQTLALRDGHDIFVQQIITNYGERPIDYSAFAMYPDQARQERLVSGLAPGATTIKRYRFTNIPANQISRVRVGLKELEGSRILNDEVEVR